MKALYFFICLFTAQFFLGIQTSYSAVKKDISEDLGVTESFFSIVEMLNMLGRFVSTIGVVIFPPNKLKLTYFIFVVVETVSTIIVLGMHIFPEHFEVFFAVGMIGLGFGRGIFMFPYLLMYENFQHLDGNDEEKKSTSKMLLNIYFGMMVAGHAIVIPLTRWFIEDLGVSWAGSMLIFGIIYLFTGILVCAFVPEQLVRREEEIEDKTFGEKTCQIFQTLKNFYQRKGSNVLLLFDYCFLENHISSTVYWSSYFFMKEGFGFDATWMLFTYSIGNSVGALLINPVLKCFPSIAPIATVIFLLLESGCFVAVYFVEKTIDNLGIFIVLFGLAAVFLISPYSRSSSTEVAERVESDRQNYLVLNFMRVVRELVSALSMVFIGQMMEIDIINFIYILTGNAFLSAFLHIVRRIKEKNEKEAERQQTKGEGSQTGDKGKENEKKQEKKDKDEKKQTEGISIKKDRKIGENFEDFFVAESEKQVVNFEKYL